MLTRSLKFRGVAESLFCKGGGDHLAHVVTLCYLAEFPSVDISCESSAKQSELMPNSRICEPLAFPSQDQGSFEELQKVHFAKGHGYLITLLA